MIRFTFPLSRPNAPQPHHRFFKDMGGKKNKMGVRISGFRGAVKMDLVFFDSDVTVGDVCKSHRDTPLRVYVNEEVLNLNTEIQAKKLSQGCAIRIEQVSRANQSRMYCLRCTSVDGKTIARSPPVFVMSKTKKRRPPSIGDVDKLYLKVQRLEEENERLEKKTERLEKENRRLSSESVRMPSLSTDAWRFSYNIDSSSGRTNSSPEMLKQGLEEVLLLPSIAGYLVNANIYPQDL